MSPPEIIYVLGLQKTGLGSLATMFEKAGHYRTRTREASRVRNRILEDVIANRQPNLQPYFSDDTLFVDWPAPLLYEEAYQRFGDRARYILSIRSSPEKWVESLKTHALTLKPSHNKHQMIYGFRYPHGHEQDHIDYYRAHNEAARNFFLNQGASDLFCEVCIEDRASVSNMLAFLNLENSGLDYEHTNTGEARLEKFLFRKQYNSLRIKIESVFR